MTIRIIDGKRYNTDTAEEIASYWNGYPRNDFKFLQETLYQTKKGALFLLGDGGAMTKYSETGFSGTCGKSGVVVPLSDDEARQWLEDHDEVDSLERLFSDSVEDA